MNSMQKSQASAAPKNRVQRTTPAAVKTPTTAAETGLLAAVDATDLAVASRPLPQDHIARLQYTHGNAYVMRLLDARSAHPPSLSPARSARVHRAPASTAESSAESAPASTTDAPSAVATSPVSGSDIYFSIDYGRLQTFILPRRSFSLQQLAVYLFNDANMAAKLGQLNGLTADAQASPGDRILVTGLNDVKFTAHSLAHFQAAPKVPSYVSDPSAWLAEMGVASPEEFVARKKQLDLQLPIDVMLIVMVLNESHYSDSDEGRVIAILQKWANEKLTANSRTYAHGGYYFDQLLMKLRGKTKKISYITEEISDYYSMIFNHFDRVAEVKALVDQHSILFAGDTGMKEMSVGDAVVDAVRGIPGAITMTAGAFVSSLPGKWANKAGAWLNRKGKEYLHVVGWTDDMIEMSAGISGMTGMALAAIAPGGGGPAKLAQLWNKADQVVSALKQLTELQDLLTNLEALKESVQTKVEAITALVTDSGKLVGYLLGFEEDQAGIADWVLSAQEEAVPAARGSGLQGITNKFKSLMNGVRRALQPVFQVRARFIELTEFIAGLVLSIPQAQELIEIALDPAKRSMAGLRRVARNFSVALGEKLKMSVDAVRESIVTQIDAVFGKSEVLTRDMIFNAVTSFTRTQIAKSYPSISDIMNVVDSDGSQLKTHIVQRILPDELLSVVDVVNEKFQGLMAKVQPAVEMVKGGLKTLGDGINRSIERSLVKPLTSVLMRAPADGRQLVDPNQRMGDSGLLRPAGVLPLAQRMGHGVVQRAIDWATLEAKLVKRFKERAIEAFSFAKATSPEDQKKYESSRDQAARLRGRPVLSRTNPALPEGYYYTPAGDEMPTGIKRKPNTKQFLPKLVIRKAANRYVIDLGFFEKEIHEKETEDAAQAHKAVMAELGPEAEKYLKGHGDRYAKGRPGHAFTTAERDAVDEIGYAPGGGCHSTGVTEPGTTTKPTSPAQKATKAYKAGKGSWIPDHQPMDSVWQGGGAREGIRFYPHSKAAASQQMLLAVRYRAKMMKLRGRKKHDWASGVKSEWFW